MAQTLCQFTSSSRKVQKRYLWSSGDCLPVGKSGTQTPSTWWLYLESVTPKISMQTWLHQVSGRGKSMEHQMPRCSWARTDITFAHTSLARTDHVTRLHLTAKEAGKCSLAECPERKGKSFPPCYRDEEEYIWLGLHFCRADHSVKKNRLYIEKRSTIVHFR